MSTKEKIFNILVDAAGKWINVDEISAAIKLNRADVTTTVNSMMKSKTYPSIERNIKDKTVGTGGRQRRQRRQRRQYTIKYRIKANK